MARISADWSLEELGASLGISKGSILAQKCTLCPFLALFALSTSAFYLKSTCDSHVDFGHDLQFCSANFTCVLTLTWLSI